MDDACRRTYVPWPKANLTSHVWTGTVCLFVVFVLAQLTDDFVNLMEGPRSACFKRFRELCVRTFMELRKQRHKIILLVEMMVNGNENLPCFAGKPQVKAGRGDDDDGWTPRHGGRPACLIKLMDAPGVLCLSVRPRWRPCEAGSGPSCMTVLVWITSIA